MKPVLPGILLMALFAPGCRSTPVHAPPTPVPFAEHTGVNAAIESNRLADAAATLATAPDTPDVHYLKARLAEANQDTDTAMKEIKQAVAAAPDFAEYQYELGVIGGMPRPGETIDSEAARFGEAGRALDEALKLSPNDGKYLYTRGYYLSMADKGSGGNPALGRKLYDRVLEKAPDSAWAHRVLFDRAAQQEKWNVAEEEAGKAGDRDPTVGTRLFLLVGGTRLRDGNLERARADLEAAAKINPPAATSFCDAGFALDGGSHPELAHDFWARCLALLPDGPKAAMARARLEAEKSGDKTLRMK
jgi:tetratricopeptide (TPR) repeat protein